MGCQNPKEDSSSICYLPYSGSYLSLALEWKRLTEVFRVPVSRPDDRAIPSGRPTDQASSIWTMCHTVRTFTVLTSYYSSLHPSRRLNSPSGRLSVIDQLHILSKFNLREYCFNRPDDVDSSPDALIRKARITIQISPSERQ
jgi:hypothetical protein